MTAWQDQPPVSRRQVRQTERDGTVDSSSSLDPDAPQETPFASLARQGWEADARRSPAPEGSPSGHTASAGGRRAQQPATNHQPDAPAPAPEPLAYITQARPQVPSYEGASFRRLSIAADPERSEPSEGTTDAGRAPAGDQPTFRTRDYSPDGRRSAFRPLGPPLNWAPPTVVPQAGTPAVEDSSAERPEPRSDLTLTRRQMRELGIGGFVTTPNPTDEAEAAAAAAVVESAVPSDSATAVAPVTREQTVVAEPVSEDAAASVVEAPSQRLRFRDRIRQPAVESELEKAAAEQAAAASVATGAFLAPDAAVRPPELVEPPAYRPFVAATPSVEATPEVTVAEIVEAPADSVTSPAEHFEAVSTPVADAESVVVAELEPHPESAPAFEDLLFPGGTPVITTVEPEPADAIPMTFESFMAERQAPAPQAPDSATVPAWIESVAPVEAHIEPAFVEPATVEPAVVEPAFVEPATVEPAAGQPAAPAAGDSVPEDSYSPPIGHWSTQALIDDDEQVQASAFGRDVAATSGAITTSALVLPSMPTAEDIMGPLSGTGEILITGSINLPSAMGSTGVYPARYDHSDVDALLEAGDREDSDPESAPVRAIRAISTNTASGDVINSMKPRKTSRLPMILIVSAAVMAVGVVVLLVAGLIFKIF
jgi:hypothetical protein